VPEARIIQNDTLHIVFKGIVELEVAQWRAAGRRVLEWMWRKRSEEIMNTKTSIRKNQKNPIIKKTFEDCDFTVIHKHSQTVEEKM